MRNFFILLFCILIIVKSANAQAPTLYIHFVSHNEPTDTLENMVRYAKAKTNMLQMAGIIDSKNVKWNIQTSDGFVMGALQDQANTGNNIFRVLASAPYSDNIEIDPRSKNKPGRNIADQWYLLDSAGANPTHTLGGFIWAVCPPANSSSIDWWPYKDTIVGNVYKNKWKCSLLSGAGSLTPHCNDLNDFGIFKPDTITNFYKHNPNRTLWCLGTGCAPVLDSNNDEGAIIQMIQGQVDSIQKGLWPSNKFYVTRIMTNQREYGPLFFQKVNRVIDSLKKIPSSMLVWATINETFNAFKSWQSFKGLDYSQWKCGEKYTPSEIKQSFNQVEYKMSYWNQVLSIQKDNILITKASIYNEWGTCLKQIDLTDYSQQIDLSVFPTGLYFLKLENGLHFKFIHQ